MGKRGWSSSSRGMIRMDAVELLKVRAKEEETKAEPPPCSCSGALLRDAPAPRGSSYLHALHATKEQRQKAGGGQLSDVLSAGDNEWGLSTEDASARPPSGSRETLFLPAVPPSPDRHTGAIN